MKVRQSRENRGPLWAIEDKLRAPAAEYRHTVALVNVTTRRGCFDGTPADNLALIEAVGEAGGERITWNMDTSYSYALKGSTPQRWNAAAAVILNSDGTAFAYKPTWTE